MIKWLHSHDPSKVLSEKDKHDIESQIKKAIGDRKIIVSGSEIKFYPLPLDRNKFYINAKKYGRI